MNDSTIYRVAINGGLIIVEVKPEFSVCGFVYTGKTKTPAVNFYTELEFDPDSTLSGVRFMDLNGNGDMSPHNQGKGWGRLVVQSVFSVIKKHFGVDDQQKVVLHGRLSASQDQHGVVSHERRVKFWTKNGMQVLKPESTDSPMDGDLNASLNTTIHLQKMDVVSKDDALDAYFWDNEDNAIYRDIVTNINSVDKIGAELLVEERAIEASKRKFTLMANSFVYICVIGVLATTYPLFGLLVSGLFSGVLLLLGLNFVPRFFINTFVVPSIKLIGLNAQLKGCSANLVRLLESADLERYRYFDRASVSLGYDFSPLTELSSVVALQVNLNDDERLVAKVKQAIKQFQERNRLKSKNEGLYN